jgi:hypothetical protein
MMKAFAEIGQGMLGALHRSCFLTGAYQCVPPSIPDKELAVVMQEVPKDEDAIFGWTVRHYEINKKSRIREIRDAHDKWTLQMNFGRNLELQRECYRGPLYHHRSRHYPPDIPTIYFFIIKEAHLETQKELLESKAKEHDPRQKFTPSTQLVELVEKNMVRPDQEDMISVWEYLRTTKPQEEDELDNIRNLITEQVEGFLTSCAKRKSRTNETMEISRDGRFTNEACMELIDRLALNLYESVPVLEVLHKELFVFLSNTDRIRAWGHVSADNLVIKFDLNPKAFLLPGFPTLDDGRWRTT